MNAITRKASRAARALGDLACTFGLSLINQIAFIRQYERSLHTDSPVSVA